MIWGATKSVLYGSIIMFVISLFGLIDSAMILLSTPLLFLSGLIFAAISLIFVAIVPGIDSFNYFYTLFMTPMFLFSGIFFPLDGIPEIISKIAFLTPLYHLVNVCRFLSTGNLSAIVSDIIWMLIVSFIIIPYALRLMRRRVIK